jgi:hypothetical protein
VVWKNVKRQALPSSNKDSSTKIALKRAGALDFLIKLLFPSPNKKL